MKKIPLVEYAHDSGTFTQEVSDSIEYLVEHDVGVKVGLTAIHTYDQAGRPIAKTILHRVHGKEDEKKGTKPAKKRKRGRLIWDAKFGDLTHQVIGAVEGIVQLSVYGLTIKALDDTVMLAAAVKARDTAYARILAGFEEKDDQGEKKIPPPRPILFGVTDLSSSGKIDFENTVLRRAERISKAGFDGIVVPGNLLGPIKKQFPHLITLVVGIRPQWATYIPNDDQKRTLTHLEAAELGADHLVIGRPISCAPDQMKALHDILNELKGFSELALS